MSLSKTKDTMTPAIKDRIKRFELVVGASFREFAEVVIQNARGNLYNRLKNPGSLLHKFDWNIRTGPRVSVKNIHHFARGTEFGTRPHEIKGRPFLKFFKEGRWHVRRRVMHPGTRPTYFLRDAFRTGIPVLKEALKRYLGG